MAALESTRSCVEFPKTIIALISLRSNVVSVQHKLAFRVFFYLERGNVNLIHSDDIELEFLVHSIGGFIAFFFNLEVLTYTSLDNEGYINGFTISGIGSCRIKTVN